MRVGTGYDVHRLTEGRKLILGGVEIPHTMGLMGHSDADVAVHAIMDALLGAAALGEMWPGRFICRKIRLTSKPPQKKVWDLPEAGRELRRRQSAP